MSTTTEIKQAPATSAVQQSDNVAHALSGAGGGLLSMALTYPLITLSTRAQVESKKADTNVLLAARRIFAREGLRGLYAGLESALFGITVTNFVYYYWYEWTRAFFTKAAEKAGRVGGKLTALESMAAGAVAGSLTVLMTNPIWVVNTRMTARKSESDEVLGAPGQKKAAPSTFATLRSIIKEEGVTRLFAGVLPALVLVINPILQYTIFEQLKQVLEKRRKVTPTDSFYLGALGKLAATSITYPYITVKSRAHVATNQKEGMFSSFNRILKEEGWSGLYGGMYCVVVDKLFANVIRRHWTKGHPERAHCRSPLRTEGCPLRRYHQGQKDNCCQEGLSIDQSHQSREVIEGNGMIL